MNEVLVNVLNHVKGPGGSVIDSFALELEAFYNIPLLGISSSWADVFFEFERL